MARLNAKYGQLPRIESSEPDYNTIDKWASVPWTPPPSDDSDAASSESDTSDGEDGVRAQDDIVVLLDMATKVREQSDLIDILQARLACAEKRASAAEAALKLAAERCALAVDEAFANGVGRRAARRRLAHHWVCCWNEEHAIGEQM